MTYTFRKLFYLAILFNTRLISYPVFFLFFFFLLLPRHKVKWTSGRQHVNDAVVGENHSVRAMYLIDCYVTGTDRDSETKLKRSFFFLSQFHLTLSCWEFREIPRGLIVRFVPSSYQWKLFSGNASFPSLMTFRFAFPFSPFPGGFPRRADWKR